MLISIEMKRQGDNNQHIERRNNDDNFEIFKLKVLMDIEKLKGGKNMQISTLFIIS